MARLRVGHSYWLDVFRGPVPRLPSLRGRHRADIAVVGGGVTGCAAALLFARAGARVVLVESRHIGRGSTAASTALLMQEPDVDFTELADRYGAGVARRIWACSRAAVTSMRRTLADLGGATLHGLPSLYFTNDDAAVGALRHEAALRRRAGLDSRSLDAEAVRALAGIDAKAGILTPGNAEVDPYRACLAFARGARAEGAVMFERSPVLRVDATRDGVTLALRGGSVSADWAVVATGYATEEFKPLAGRFTMMNTYVIATPRLSAAERRRVGLGDVMLWDTERPYHYLRWTPDQRLLFGGRDHPRVPRATRAATLRRRADELMSDLADLYPSLDGVRPDYAWEGLFATTPDGLPYVGPHRRYPRHLFALGYGGNGMTLGFFAAQALVRFVQGHPAPDDERVQVYQAPALRLTGRSRARFAPGRSLPSPSSSRRRRCRRFRVQDPGRSNRTHSRESDRRRWRRRRDARRRRSLRPGRWERCRSAGYAPHVDGPDLVLAGVASIDGLHRPQSETPGPPLADAGYR